MSAAAATVNVCPMCCKEKPAADEHGHCSYACASGGGSAVPKKKGGLTVTTLADGRLQLGGATFAVRDQIKARGGRWDPAARVWTLPAGTDTTFEAPPPPPPPPPAAAPVYVRRDRAGRCCRAATVSLDAENPQGPLWYHCKLHGSCKSSYTGD